MNTLAETVSTAEPGPLAKWRLRWKAASEAFLLSEVWCIGIVRSPIESFLDPSFSPEVQWIPTGDDAEFCADAFGIMDNNGRTIVAEKYSYRDRSIITADGLRGFRAGRGHITSLQLDESGRVTKKSVAIDHGKHISYPCAFAHDNGWYIVAEELSRNALELYRRDNDGSWRTVKQLLTCAAIDPTICFYGDRWWLFSTTPKAPLSELQIWFADSPDGDWQPHPGNPVRIDAGNCRPAGTPFIAGGALYRPTQNCTKAYGGSVVINCVDVLSRSEFAEHPVREIFPPRGTKYSEGIHTLSSFGAWTLIDAKLSSWKPSVTLHRFINRLCLLKSSGH